MPETAAEEGIAMRFDIIRPGNTFDAHRILRLAVEHDKQDALKERLLRAYLCEGALMSDPETLVSLASSVELDPDLVQSVLSSDLYADDVRTDEARAAELGAHGVPFFVIGERFGVSGAQPAEAFLQVLERVGELEEPEHSEGDACQPGHC